MILNKVGEAFEYEGKKYEIGAEIIGTDESEYRELVGTITEIRVGADKDTENETPDIYCTFTEPVTPYDVEQLEKRFSELYGATKKLADIALDEVIMAPSMIASLSEIENDGKEITLYAVVEEWAEQDSQDLLVKLFSDRSSAKRFMRRVIQEEMQCGGIFEMRGEEGIVEESSEDRYEIYSEGYYCSSHFSICIEEHKVHCSSSFIQRLTDGILHSVL